MDSGYQTGWYPTSHFVSFKHLISGSITTSGSQTPENVLVQIPKRIKGRVRDFRARTFLRFRIVHRMETNGAGSVSQALGLGIDNDVSFTRLARVISEMKFNNSFGMNILTQVLVDASHTGWKPLGQMYSLYRAGQFESG